MNSKTNHIATDRLQTVTDDTDINGGLFPVENRTSPRTVRIGKGGEGGNGENRGSDPTRNWKIQ